MNLILTGVTGTLGSQILYEIHKEFEFEKIYLLIRAKGSLSSKLRLKNLVKSLSYNRKINHVEELYDKIELIEPEYYFSPSLFLEHKNNYFIHCAGYVNLTTDISQRQEIFDNNFIFTKKIFNAFEPYIKKFVFVSTAFSIGDIGGKINNNYHENITTKHRNAYEESKYLAEKFLVEKTSSSSVNIQILRPSVIGGFLSQSPIGYISKYMVYYTIGKFFYNNPFTEYYPVRISINFKSGLNIIPLDYVVKVIVKVLFNNDIKQLNIVHRKTTNLKSGLKRIIESVGYKNFTFLDGVIVNDIPNKNKLETMYYSTIGKHFSPYNLSKPHEFDTNILENIVTIPNYNLEDYLENTIKAGMENKFSNEKW